MWVFGYGSLVWKVDFPYERKLVGHIKGYVRRFYHKSTVHRGIPSKPGRAVTLLSSTNPKDEVWGIAYKISKENTENVVNHLDFRERGGYERRTVVFHPSNPIQKIDPSTLDNSCEDNVNSQSILPATPTPSEELPFQVAIYISSEDNENYAGIESIDTIARHIVDAHGPSGPNTEYLYKLAMSMRIIAPGVQDDHLFSLERLVKKLEDEKSKNSITLDDSVH